MIQKDRSIFGLKKGGPILVALLVAVIYAAYSCLRHWHFGSSGFDLGIFDQAIWHYSRFEAPQGTIRIIPNLLGDHFHPILTLLAPLYWIWSSPYALLIFQAFCFASAVLPIWLFSKKRLGSVPAYLIAISYALFWGVQNAIAFDFHEIALAVPLIAWSIYFIDQKKWRWFFGAILLLLLVKEDQALLVVFFGIYLLTQKQYWRGLVTALSGTIWFLLATKVFIPYFAGNAGYTYWTYTQFGPDLASSLRSVITNPVHVFEVLFSSTTKLATGWRLFYPFALFSFFSPLLILTIPLILERFLSNVPHFWLQVFHYSATISPVLAMSAADGLSRLSRFVKIDRFRRQLTLVLSLLILGLNVRLLPKLPLWRLTDPGFYRPSISDIAGREALRFIPKESSVLAQDGIIPHLSQRANIYTLQEGAPLADYIITSSSVSPWPYKDEAEINLALTRALSSDYEQIFSKDGWTVLKKN